ncbi:MAG TPA: hypothetical protein VGS28_01220 [Candidatus Saccharimonadales bacterium]|nr:hypothetical protein [Candidatus Saccharimonadales bacterium]
MPLKVNTIAEKLRRIGSRVKPWFRKKWLWAIATVLILIVSSAIYCISANPYSSDTFVQAPFTTHFSNGKVVLTTRYTPHFYSGWLASAVGYYEQAVTVVWDRLSSPKMPAGSEQSIVDNIYKLRFNPNKPYIISGDQFGGLYIRNMSIFYQDLLDPQTAINTTDLHNRERIAVQSLAYALSSMQQLHHPVTTLLPITPRRALAFNFWNYPSDSMFSIFALLTKLESIPATRQVAFQLQHQYGSGIEASLQNYLLTVRNPQTGLVRSNIHLSGARDAAFRESSFYDNVILWKTEQLGTNLGFYHATPAGLASLRQTIINRYWDNSQGHFIDDLTPGHQHSYSSDWLITLPLGFLDPANQTDRAKLIAISKYIDDKHLAEPLPIRYTADHVTEDFFVRFFAGSYGTTAIWSYWGDLYITLETNLYQQTHQPLYAHHVETALSSWSSVIIRDRGYPETLDGKGKMYETLVYESIRRNGWVVDFESVADNWQRVNHSINSQ